MCGLGGVTQVGPSRLVVDEAVTRVLRAMRHQLEHRGPDDAAVVEWAGGGLAFTRLSLTAPGDGRQPFSSDDGLVHVIANGEIYNHRELEGGLPGLRLRTKSDCEVLLHLYERHGDSFLDEVRGMYAVVVVDNRRDQVLLARDRFGIKPLFFATPDGYLVWGSEIKTLFTHPGVSRRLDWSAALRGQALSSEPVITPGPVNSWFTDVRMVEPGATLTFDVSDGRCRRRAIARPTDQTALASPDAYVREFAAILEDSVRSCATSDAGVGLFLSGGVDSCAVAALSRGFGIPTFTTLSTSTLLSGDARGAWDCARELGLPHHQVLFTDADRPDADGWANLVRIVETPQASPEMFYKYEMHRYAKRVYPELKAMMLGAAADEYCGGYTTTFAADEGWAGFLTVLDSMAEDALPAWTAGPYSLLRAGWAETVAGGGSTDAYHRYVAWKSRDVTQYNVWHEDRTAAANSIEARVPFLDQRLVSLVESIPAQWRPELLWDKRIVREAVRHVLPDRFRTREKVGFYYGPGAEHTASAFASMIAADNYRLLDMALATDTARAVIDPDAVREVVEVIRASPGRHRFQQVLSLINLGLLEGLPAADLRYPAPGAPARESVDLTAAGGGELPVPESVRPDRRWRRDSVLEFGADTTIVADLRDGTVLLADEAVFRYQLDHDDRDWITFLCGIDGDHRIDELEARSGASVENHADELDELIVNGLLKVNR